MRLPLRVLTFVSCLAIVAGLAPRVSKADCGQFVRYNLISETSASPGFNETSHLAQTMVSSNAAKNSVTILARGVTDEAAPKNYGDRHVTFLEVTAGAETHNHWHTHKGALFATVKSGDFTYYTVNLDGSCTSRIFHAGETFVVPAGTVHVDANFGSETAEVLVFGIMEDEDFGAASGLGFAANATEVPDGPGCPAFGIQANNFCYFDQP